MIVGDEKYGRALGVHLLKQGHDLSFGIRIQFTGGFVGQQQGRLVHQGAGHGDAAFFTAGDLIGIGVDALGQAYALQEFHQTEDLYREALALMTGMSPKETLDIVLFLGYLNILTEDYVEAVDYYTKALQVPVDDRYQRSGIHGMLGYALYSLEDLERSRIEYQRAVDILGTGEPTREAAQYLGWLGLIHFERAEYREALRKYLLP